MKKEKVNKETGEIEGSGGVLGECIFIEERRPDGSLHLAQDFSNCPSMAEQHTAHLTDINYLMETYRPDELAAYINARNQHRKEILGWDFSSEPSLQDAKNVVNDIRKRFEELDPEIRNQFKNHLEFVKFIDNPQNAERMIKLGLATKRELKELSAETGTAPATTKTPPDAPPGDQKTGVKP